MVPANHMLGGRSARYRTDSASDDHNRHVSETEVILGPRAVGDGGDILEPPGEMRELGVKRHNDRDCSGIRLRQRFPLSRVRLTRAHGSAMLDGLGGDWPDVSMPLDHDGQDKRPEIAMTRSSDQPNGGRARSK